MQRSKQTMDLAIAFQGIKEHLLRQQAPSILQDGKCAYRGLSGRRCALGALIPDELYSPGIEGVGMTNVLVKDASSKWTGFSCPSNQKCLALAQTLNAVGVPATAAMHELLCSLQRIHDQFRGDEWFRKLKRLNEEFKARGFDLGEM